jgi:DNA-binding transcriptional MerR regulator
VRLLLPIASRLDLGARMSADQHAEVNIELNAIGDASVPVLERMACPLRFVLATGASLGNRGDEIVWHYHRLGLVDEPRRDTCGYRRYTSTDLLRLVQVRALAEAGVPLAEIADLLDAGPERFAAAVDDVERRLADRISELVGRRIALRRLVNGDRALLPDRACALHDLQPGGGGGNSWQFSGAAPSRHGRGHTGAGPRAIRDRAFATTANRLGLTVRAVHTGFSGEGGAAATASC